TSSTNSFPDRNAYQSVNGGGEDVFVAKFNASLSGDDSLIYSTMIGGSGSDRGYGIAVDSAGQAFITGITGSLNYPVPNGFRSVNQVNEAFVSQLSAGGNALVNSSFLGGSDQDEGWDIALGTGGMIYVAGDTLSPNFPTALPFQSANAGGRDFFVAKVKFGVGVLSSSYLGGSGTEFSVRLAVQGNKIFLAGATGSSNLQTTLPVLQPIPSATSNNEDGFVAKIIDSRLDSVGVFRPGPVFLLTQSTTTVVSQQATLTSQLAGSRGVSGDWDGDGTDSIGSFSGGVWKVRDQNFPTVVLPAPFGAKTINFGASGDLPVVGDWNGDGIDTPGVFRPSTGQFTVTDSTSTGPSFNANVTRVTFGLAGDRPIAGDWDGDGKDSVAVYRPSTGQTFFTNADVSVLSTGSITLNPGVDITAFLGIAEDLPVGGDWNGDGIDSLGLWRPSTAQFFLSDDNANLRPTFIFGITGDQPIVGDWDGKP
ncbi:MAG: SBBP repeat-containing protein, partial [Pyrinomonadaceae bacterium]